MNIRIKEAIKLHEIYYGRKITQTELAKKIWPNSSSKVQQVLMYRLSSGRYYTSVKPEWIKIIAEATGIEYEYIMGTSSFKLNRVYRSALRYAGFYGVKNEHLNK